MVVELIAAFLLGAAWDLCLGYREGKKWARDFEEFEQKILGMTHSEVTSFIEEIGLDIEVEVMHTVDEHHEECGLQDMEYEELQRLVDNSEWEDLVGGDLGDDIPHWHGTHIPDTEQSEASREHLLDFHKYSYYWRIMKDVVV